MTTAQYIKDVPSTPHFAALVERSFSYDDGYGTSSNPSTSTAHLLDYVVLADEAAVKEWILGQENYHRFSAAPAYRIIRVTPVEITKTVNLTIT